VGQKLNIEKTSVGGEKTVIQVDVIRSWQDASGGLILLFANGSYGYRNGEPVRSAAEFGIIGSAVQRKAAMAWWERAGEEISRAYYAAKVRREEELQGDFQASPAGKESELDGVLYTRAPSGTPDEVSGPFSWMDLFPNRPDWWGQALSIQFGDFVYRQAEAALAGPPATIEEKGAELEHAGKGRPRAPKAGGRQEV
jgi:hypothetical protein